MAITALLASGPVWAQDVTIGEGVALGWGQFSIALNTPCAGCGRGTAPDRRAIVRRRTGATAGGHAGEDRAGLSLLFAWLWGPPAFEAFYSGPWRDGIVRRYGMEPEIEFFTVSAKTDNQAGTVTVVEAAQSA